MTRLILLVLVPVILPLSTTLLDNLHISSPLTTESTKGSLAPRSDMENFKKPMPTFTPPPIYILSGDNPIPLEMWWKKAPRYWSEKHRKATELLRKMRGAIDEILPLRSVELTVEHLTKNGWAEAAFYLTKLYPDKTVALSDMNSMTIRPAAVGDVSAVFKVGFPIRGEKEIRYIAVNVPIERKEANQMQLVEHDLVQEFFNDEHQIGLIDLLGTADIPEPYRKDNISGINITVYKWMSGYYELHVLEDEFEIWESPPLPIKITDLATKDLIIQAISRTMTRLYLSSEDKKLSPIISLSAGDTDIELTESKELPKTFRTRFATIRGKEKKEFPEFIRDMFFLAASVREIDDGIFFKRPDAILTGIVEGYSDVWYALKRNSNALLSSSLDDSVNEIFGQIIPILQQAVPLLEEAYENPKLIRVQGISANAQVLNFSVFKPILDSLIPFVKNKITGLSEKLNSTKENKTPPQVCILFANSAMARITLEEGTLQSALSNIAHRYPELSSLLFDMNKELTLKKGLSIQVNGQLPFLLKGMYTYLTSKDKVEITGLTDEQIGIVERLLSGNREEADSLLLQQI